jgi:hypothetical protein
VGTEVIQLEPHQRATAARVLAVAFEQDEQFARFFPREDSSRSARVAALFSWSCELHDSAGMPILGALQGGQIVGVATVQPAFRTHERAWPIRLWWHVRNAQTTLRLGRQAARSMKQYSQAVAALRTTPLCHYVSNIGVLPSAQRGGIRGLLLDAAFELACADPLSQGLALDTFRPELARSLEVRGWSVSGPVRAGGVDGFALFRPCPASPAVASSAG